MAVRLKISLFIQISFFQTISLRGFRLNADNVYTWFFKLMEKISTHIIDGCRRSTEMYATDVRQFPSFLRRALPSTLSLYRRARPWCAPIIGQKKLIKITNVTAGNVERALVENKRSRFCIHFRTWDGRCAFFRQRRFIRNVLADCKRK